MKKILVIGSLFIVFSCTSTTPNSPYPAPSPGPYPAQGQEMLDRNSEPGVIIVVPPEELREWVKKTEKWAYEAELQAIRSERAAARCETANALTIIKVETERSLMQSLLDEARSLVDKCQAIFNKIMRK